MLNKNNENFTWFQKLNKISEWKKPKQKIQCTHKKDFEFENLLIVIKGKIPTTLL